MKEGLDSRIIRLTALILVAVSTMLVVNQALFIHTHIDANGEVIVHSHPFQKGDQKDIPVNAHHHTGAQYHFFDSLTLLFPILFLAIALLHLLIKQDFFIADETIFISSFLVVRQGRDPPCLSH
ncbi:hypothetical protein ACT29H_04810 [Thermophagus sp. OGC60D27]|uniref:hypothetical protein n=1 Tax=Thermophagus sp. OGC60D27 TaxID=3458415 RepID=UPI0040382461